MCNNTFAALRGVLNDANRHAFRQEVAFNTSSQQTSKSVASETVRDVNVEGSCQTDNLSGKRGGASRRVVDGSIANRLKA